MGLSVSIRKKVKGFELDAGFRMGDELLAILGASGSGKSLTLQAIAGLLTPDEGHIELDGSFLYGSSNGRNVKNVKPQDRGIGYVFQHAALFPHMTVRENVGFGLRRLHREEKNRRVSELLDDFFIADLAGKKPAEISGGQKQRVALARALAPRPRLLLLDEPFSALDAPVRAEMRRVILATRARFNVPVVLVTHDLLDAQALADRVVIYEGGRVVQAGRLAEVMARPATDAVARLVDPGLYQPNFRMRYEVDEKIPVVAGTR